MRQESKNGPLVRAVSSMDARVAYRLLLALPRIMLPKPLARSQPIVADSPTLLPDLMSW